MASANIDPTRLDKALVTEIIHGVMSPDVDRLQSTIANYFHPNVRFIHQVAQVEGRDKLAKLYRADHATFDIKIRVVDVGIDQDELLALAWVDQDVNLRLAGALQWLIAERSCPAVVRLTFQRRPDGRLWVVEQYDHISTYYIPSLIGPWAAWAHHHVFMPLGGILGGWASDILDATAQLIGAVFTDAPNVLSKDTRGFAAVRTESVKRST